MVNKVIQWAIERNLIKKGNYNKQIIKVYEEMGELSKALLLQKKDDLEDAFGDVLVTLIILNEQLIQEKLIYKDLFQCLELAYNEIKDRKGKTENGTFIKNI